MAYVPSSVIADLTEVYSSKKDFSGRNHGESDIFKDIRQLNDEEVVHSLKDEENIEENFKLVVRNVTSNEEGCSNQKMLESNEASGILVNEIHVENNSRVDKECCDTSNSSDNTKKTKRFLNFEHSDSIEEISSHKVSLTDSDYHSEACEWIVENNSKSKILRKVIDSESEEDTQRSESNNFLHENISTTAKSYRALIDSESEEEKQNETKSEDMETTKNNNFPQMVHENISTTAESYQALIDSESEEENQNEETENNTLIASEKTTESKDTKKKLVKKRKGSIRTAKDEAMRQIHSETQRLLRETEISLPYHRPKQRTLQEFLNRRKLLTALPKAPSTAAKLKMSSAIVSQVLAEKEKEAEFFYKSSDSEDDNVQQSMSFISKDTESSFITNERKKTPSIDIHRTYIQDSKKIETNTQDLQDNEKEIVQSNHLNLDVLRCETSLEKNFYKANHQTVELSTDNNGSPDDGSNISLHQTINEYNQNLPKLNNLSRKLFDTYFENGLNDASEVNLDEQEVTKGIVETIITSFNKKDCVNNGESSKITIQTDNQLSKIHQVNSEIINEKDKNLVIEATHSNSINNKEIIKIYQSDNVIYSNSDDRKNEKKDKCVEINEVLSITDTQSKIQDNSLLDECEKSDNHVLGLPLPKFEDETLSNRKILPTISNSKVTLRGSPGMIIDLTEDAKDLKGVSTLLDRFFCKHANSKKQNDNKSEVTVIHLQNTPNGPLPIKEVLPYKVPVNVDNSELNKPGAKLMRLKEDLKLQMTLKRNKEWKQKETELQAQKRDDWNEEEESDYDLDEQEETELGLELSGSEESEPEENDICIEDKKRSRCLFADDEAEVTDNEDSSAEENDADCAKRSKRSTSFKYRKEDMDEDVSEIKIDEEDDDSDDEEKKENEESLGANMENEIESDFEVRKNSDNYKNRNDRKTRRLIEEFQDDSNIINPSDLRDDNNSQLNMIIDADASKTHCENNDWIMSENESNTSVCQHVEVATRSQICKTPLTKTSMLDLVSPITQLSVLNTTLDSSKKDSSEKKTCLIDKHEFLSMENTQSDESSQRVCNIRNKAILKKKLFDDIRETIDDEYLMRLCSGKFESTQRTELDLSSQFNITESQLYPSSGDSNAKLVDVEPSKNPDINKKVLQDIVLDDDSNNSASHTEELNKISAVHSGLKLRITSSSDEDEDTFEKPRKRSVKRLNLSDSEEENSQFSDEEDVNANNDLDGEEQYVDYDSEENEVVVIPKKDIKEVAAGFLEEEAELSESDWDSVDEDEKDLDKLEFEEADDEDIDEHKVKDQLEKIHMKQILDEDKREVRLLKELLFEDGDLHTDGTGRERKFKWRNIDKVGNNETQMCDENDGWVDVHEDEEEAKWSKLRHEREKFLEERMKCLNNQIEDELCDSQIFKFGLEAVRKSKDNESQRQDISFNKADSSENMEPIMPRNITDLLNGPNIGKKSQTIYNVIKKRSLLTRGEESLARIASLAKQGDSISHAVNTRNFVFPHIDQSTDNIIENENEVIGDMDSQIKPGKRKMPSKLSISKKRRK